MCMLSHAQYYLGHFYDSFKKMFTFIEHLSYYSFKNLFAIIKHFNYYSFENMFAFIEHFNYYSFENLFAFIASTCLRSWARLGFGLYMSCGMTSMATWRLCCNLRILSIIWTKTPLLLSSYLRRLEKHTIMTWRLTPQILQTPCWKIKWERYKQTFYHCFCSLTLRKSEDQKFHSSRHPWFWNRILQKPYAMKLVIATVINRQ